MPFDFDRLLNQTEDFLRRHIKPRHVVAAEKRRSKRKVKAAMRRFNRAVAVTGASGAGVVGYGMAVAPLGTAALIATGAATVIGAGAVLLWPQRSPLDRISREELAALVLESEAWLLEQRKLLPGRAVPALDTIFFRLNDLHPHLETLEPNGTTAWDLRRVLTDHLPRLLQSYAGLTETVRQSDPDLLSRFIEGMKTLDEELVRICREASRDHLHSLEVQGEFLKSRYKDRGIG